MRITGSAPAFRAQVGKATPLPPEANPWWWHPGRVGVPSGPPSFSAQLDEIDSNLAITYNGYAKQWQIWVKSPRMSNKVCWGWSLLFNDKRLGPHIFARLYSASMDRWGSAKKYFDAIEREMARDKERAEKQSLNDTIDQSMESFDYAKIKVGYGPSNGSKFTTFHS